MSNFRLCLPSLFCLLLGASPALAATNEITEPYQGVRLIHSRSTMPRQIDMWIVEIDMTAPGLGFLVTPSNGDLVGDTTPQTTRTFVSQVGAQLGINANFFAFAGAGPQYDLRGLSVSNGDAYSPFEAGFRDALNISAGNVATIIRSNTTSGFAHTPPTMLYNAVGGNTRLVTNGVNVAGNDVTHPRTAVATTADGKLLLFTVDGRNPGHSEGLTYVEMADILIRWGAHQAINLDGGGSTTLVMDNPVTAANDVWVLNIPSDLHPDGTRGRERINGNNLAVFAAPQTAPTQKTFVYTDFEQADVGSFNLPITFSGSNRGFNRDLSSVETVVGGAFDGQWSQRITIINDPNSDGDMQHPGGAWFARHVSGGGNPANNIARPAIGSVGFWAKTSDPNLRIGLVVDDESGLTGERGLPKNMVADGQWHPYFWNLTEPGEWEGWVNGDGIVNGHFTLDSIHIFGPLNVGSNLNATVFIDAVSHIIPGLVPGDFNGDFVVDAADYVAWRKGLGIKYTPADYHVWRASVGQAAIFSGGSSSSSPELLAVPEPASLLLMLAPAITRFRRLRRHGSTSAT